jgi:tetratricopeptide (TPR) repeat protein
MKDLIPISIEEVKAIEMAITSRLSIGQVDEGIRLFEENSHLLPELVRLECLGNLHFYQREFAEAVNCYKAANELSPDYPIARAHYLSGVQQERLGNFVAAFNQYQAAIEVDPTFVDSYTELGGLLVKAEDFEGAAQCYRDAVRLQPMDVSSHHNLVFVIERLSQSDPNRYGAELETTKAEYAKIAMTGQTISADRKW